MEPKQLKYDEVLERDLFGWTIGKYNIIVLGSETGDTLKPNEGPLYFLSRLYQALKIDYTKDRLIDIATIVLDETRKRYKEREERIRAEIAKHNRESPYSITIYDIPKMKKMPFFPDYVDLLFEMHQRLVKNEHINSIQKNTELQREYTEWQKVQDRRNRLYKMIEDCGGHVHGIETWIDKLDIVPLNLVQELEKRINDLEDIISYEPVTGSKYKEGLEHWNSLL